MDRVLDLDLEEFNNSYDWEYIFNNFIAPSGVLGYTGSTESFGREDVVHIYALAEGENDGEDWVGVFQLNDGRFASVSARCDYTGWG